MKYSLTIFALLAGFQASAQLSIGSGDMTILSGSSVTINGLTLRPSTNLTITNNSIQKISSAGAGSPSGSINRAYQFAAPLSFSGTVGIYYLPSELNGYPEPSLQLIYSSAANDPFTVVPASTVNPTDHYISSVLSNQNLYIVTAAALSDLKPIIYARPSTQYGTTNFSIVVDVLELNSVATAGTFTVKITRDARVNLKLPPDATVINGRSVQNSAWTFDATNQNYYVLTTSQTVPANDKLSFGLEGVLSPGATSGALSISSMVLTPNLLEVSVTNNSDADKIDYFQQ